MGEAEKWNGGILECWAGKFPTKFATNVLSAYQQADFVNYGLTDLGGNLFAGSFVVFGQVRLSTNANFNFTSGYARIQCQNSSAAAWTPGALLVVSNWNNSGNVHIYFGADASALSVSQLSQLIFSNPGGLPSGNYPAQLLPTGELVRPPSRARLCKRRVTAPSWC
jgi:hypothetical protein